MDENWYTNESVWSLSFFYPDLQGDLKKKKKKLQTSTGQNFMTTSEYCCPACAKLSDK